MNTSTHIHSEQSLELVHSTYSGYLKSELVAMFVQLGNHTLCYHLPNGPQCWSGAVQVVPHSL